MRRTWPILVPAILLALFGVLISYNLIVKHLTQKTGVGWFDSVCDGGQDSKVSCQDVLSSGYALFPYVPDNVDPKKKYDPRPVLGIIQLKPRPVAMYGLLYFLAFAGWYILIGRPDHRRRWMHACLLLVNLAGLAGSVYFLSIMFTKMDTWCPWCVETHAVNGLLLACNVLLWPGKRFAEFTDRTVHPAQADSTTEPGGEIVDPDRAADSPTPTDLHRRILRPIYPSRRLVMTALLAIGTTLSAFFWFFEYADKARAYAGLDRLMQQVRNHASTLYSMYQANEKYTIPIRPDDPIKNPGKLRLTLVVFSDLQCPHCRRFAKKVDHELLPQFGEDLKVVFKHFPANKACNPKVHKDMHVYACRAASAAEAARAMGGNDAFWKAHDLIFAAGEKESLAKFDYRKLAEDLALDPDEFEETMKSDAVAQRIAEDIELAIKVKLPATPALYLAGRHVPRLAVNSPVFWDAVKRKLDQVLAGIKAREKAKSHQDHAGPPAPPTTTSPAGQSATPNTPSP
ncbi:MAG: vitamin K epoxide reductase family protein [Phycisphaerae bacterium]